MPSEQQISGRLKTSQTGGGANFIILAERKYGIVIFTTLRLTPDLCFLVSLNVKNTVQVWTMATFDYN